MRSISRSQRLSSRITRVQFAPNVIESSTDVSDDAFVKRAARNYDHIATNAQARELF